MNQRLGRSISLLLLVGVAALACKKGKSSPGSSPSPPPVTVTVADASDTNIGAEFEARLEPRFAAIEKASKSLPPPITRGYLKLPAGTVLTGDNSEYIHSEDMWDLTYKPTEFQTYRITGSAVFLSCARVVRKKEPKVDEPRGKLERCAKAQYLVVIRTKKLEAPKSYSGVNFVAGFAEGDVLIYSLPEMKLLGGYPYKAESSKQVKSNEIDKDMQENLATSMKEGLRKLQPESKLYFVM
jgi:hypothetical protein